MKVMVWEQCEVNEKQSSCQVGMYMCAVQTFVADLLNTES